MSQLQPEKPYWNLFARELQHILNQHGMDLGQIDDSIGIPDEKVRQLQQSLQTPSSLPTLNPEEIKTIENTLQLHQEEMSRLRAALLATSVQRMLSDRISEDDARLAAEQILPTITLALTEHKDKRGRDNTRGDIEPAAGGYFSALDDALDAIARGENALHLSASARSYPERVKQARQACGYYNDAIDELTSLSKVLQKMPGWKKVWGQAEKGLELTNRRLQDLGQEGCYEKRSR